MATEAEIEDRIAKLIDDLSSRLAITKARRAKIYDEGYKAGVEHGLKRGHEAGFKEGFSEGKVFPISADGG